MERTLKIFISCALGAGIGAILALQIDGMFWWIGVIIGGLVGYLSYEFKAVIAASRQAWQEVFGWRLKKGWWKVLGLGFFTSLSAAITVAILLIPLFLWGQYDLKQLPFLLAFASILSGTIGIFAGFVWFVVSIGCLCIALNRKELFYNHDYEDDMKFVKDVLKSLNPATFYFYLIPRGMGWLAKSTVCKTPYAVVASLKFIKTIFILIHSEIRLLCGVDAAIGATIGYFAGSVFLGTLIGGVVGVLNYEIISRRTLHLIPLKST